MADVELLLADLAAEVEWPATPATPDIAALPSSATARRVRPRWPRRARVRIALATALALLLAAGVAMLVPGARSAILDWLRIGGVAIERVDTLPEGVAPATVTSLGSPVDAATAATILGRPFALPAGAGPPRLRGRDGVVSTVLSTEDGPVLLAQLRSDELPFVLKKLAAATEVEFVQVAGLAQGAWLAGAQHVVVGPGAPPRLAGNVLVWEQGGVTYRLEGPRLRRATALSLARSLSPR
jgi:hypothetical protein